MNYKKLSVFILLALLGYAATYRLFRRDNQVANWNVKLDRDIAIKKALETVDKLNYSKSKVGDWDTTVAGKQDRELGVYLSKNTNSLASRLLTAATAQVKFTDFHSGRNILVTLNARGETIGYQFRDPSADGPSGQPQAQNTGDTSKQPENAARALADKALAEQTLNQLIFANQSILPIPSQTQPPSQSPSSSSPSSTSSISSIPVTLSDAGMERRGRRFNWSEADRDLKLSIDAIINDKGVRSVIIDTGFTEQFKKELDSRRSWRMILISNSENFILWPAMFLALIVFFLSLAAKEIHHRLTLTFFLSIFLSQIAINVSSSFADDFRSDIVINSPKTTYWTQLLLPWLFFALFLLLISLILYLCWAAGLSQSLRLDKRRTITMELILSGKFLRKPVFQSLFYGLLSGGLFVVIPYLINASGLFRSSVVATGRAEDLFISRLPSIATILSPPLFLFFITFAFLCPLIDRYVKRPTITRTIVFIFLLLETMGAGPIATSAPALLATGIIQASILTAVYYRFDLMAAMVCVMASYIFTGSVALLSQPTASLRSSGLKVVFGIGAAMALSLFGYLRAKDPDPDEVAAPIASITTRSERERLRAEFEVARRAQQSMLPDEIPRIDGLDIAAVCRPSREVGGDLYDFLALPEGKLGIVVADVSGKGVPASLYMTLTKGLLDSISEDADDPGEILREVNRHLYDACRRKTFVTLFLGVLDPVKKSITYARAGHNPPVFHRASDNTTSLLKPAGMGLGLNGGGIFDGSLKIDSLQLAPGDSIFFYSDGITEAMNSKNEEYGEERLMVLASRIDGMRAEDALDMVMYDVGNFLGTVQPQDDQTLVVLRVS